MKIDVSRVLFLLFAILMWGAIRHDKLTISKQQREIHDLREYIAAGCHGRYTMTTHSA